MLDLARYLLGIAELLALLTFAYLGASALRSRLLPGFQGAPALLATIVLSAALLIWPAEILGLFSYFHPAPYLAFVTATGLALHFWLGRADDDTRAGGVVGGTTPEEALATAGGGGSPATTGPARRAVSPSLVPTLIALAIAAIAVLKFALETKAKLGTGMTGFDTTWYHGPFAAGFFQSGDTWSPQFLAPQFLAWFYPANAEIFHAAGMLAFGRDLLSPLLNLGWFLGCLLACWCIGRPYRVAPWSLALGAVALSLPAFADQAGEMRNDIVGTFFLLAAVALLVNLWTGEGGRDEQQAGREEKDEQRAGKRGGLGGGLRTGALVIVGLAAGLAAGTKLNFLLPAAVVVVGLAVVASRGWRWRALGVSGLAAVAGGGYWYLRNLVHGGNPLPWFDHLGPISLPAPDQPLGGREGHSVLGYLGDTVVWSDWFAPGLHDGLGFLWPLVLLAAAVGLALAVSAAVRNAGSFSTHVGEKEPQSGGRDAALALAGLVGFAAALAWLVAPTSASGPEGVPRGFESGLRYLAPALILGLALLPAAPPLRSIFQSALRSSGRSSFVALWATNDERRVTKGATRGLASVATAAIVLAVAIGYPVQRHYLENRYADPTFAAPGLNATFAWARDLTDARIATTATRQYPLYGTDLSNQVQFIGEPRPHAGFVPPTTCRRWRELLNEGDYDYAVVSHDRLEPTQPPYPPEAAWTEGPWAEIVLRKPPTIIFKLTQPLVPSACS